MKKVVFFNCEDQNDVLVEQEMAVGLDIRLELCNSREDGELAEVCADADGIVTIYSTVDAAVINRLQSCKVIVNQAIGYNNLDVAAATEKGIYLANVPDFCLYDVAMHTVALTLACARHIVPLNRQVKKGKWGYTGHVMHRLKGQVFGTVAFGNIPREMVPMLKAFGMEVLAYDPWASDEILQVHGVQRANSLEELLTQSDYVSVHCPLTDKNIGLIGERQLGMMKPTAFLINTARGKIVDETALLAALENHQIAGAALDVLAREGDGGNPLYAMENLIVTPHTAFYSEESTYDMRVKAMEQVLAVLRDGEAPSNLLNR